MDSQNPDIKLMNRIERLFSMANDKSSENEAAIAMRRARALMDKHQITTMMLDDHTMRGNGEHIGEAYYATQFKKCPQWLKNLACAVALLNDCQVLGVKSHTLILQFAGFKQDVKLASSMLDYLKNMALHHYKTLKDEYGIKGMVGRNQFLYHYSAIMINKATEVLQERANTNDANANSLMVCKYAQLKEHIDGFCPPELTTNKKTVNYNVYKAANVAADRTSLTVKGECEYAS